MKMTPPAENPYPIKCELCGRIFSRYITHSHLKAAHNMIAAYYISLGFQQTSPEWREKQRRISSGSNNGHWKGGRSNNGAGYLTNSVNGKNVYEHRTVMEAHLGRPLAKGETIHHKDKNRANNDLSNLELISASEHATHHDHEKWADGGVLRKKFPEPNIPVELTCDQCGKIHTRLRNYVDRRRNKFGQTRFYCSMQCVWLAKLR